jgi:hypothetical protein
MPDVVAKLDLSPVLEAARQGQGVAMQLPFGAELLHVGPDQSTDGGPTAWVRLDPEANLVERRFVAVATGQPIPGGPSEHAIYLDTLQVIVQSALVQANGQQQVGMTEVHLFEVW